MIDSLTHDQLQTALLAALIAGHLVRWLWPKTLRVLHQRAANRAAEIELIRPDSEVTALVEAAGQYAKRGIWLAGSHPDDAA